MNEVLKRKLVTGGVAAALVLGAGAVASAATGVGPFESNDSGFDSAHDLAERSASTSPTTPATTPDDDGLPTGETRIDGDRVETREFVVLDDGTTQTFTAGPAGIVTITRDAKSLRIVSVDPASGWTVVKTETGLREVQVHLANGAMTVRLDAEIEDGAIRIRVRQRGIAAPGATPTSPPPTRLDNSGPGSNNSGPGSTGHNDSGSDDHSGSGGSGSGGSGSGGSGHSGGHDDSPGSDD